MILTIKGFYLEKEEECPDYLFSHSPQDILSKHVSSVNDGKLCKPLRVLFHRMVEISLSGILPPICKGLFT